MKVIVSAPLPGDAVARLAALHHVIVAGGDLGLGRDGLLALAPQHRDTAGLVVLLTDRIDAAVLDAFPALRAVGNFAVGVDNIDLAAARARGVVVCNTPDVLTDATADFAFALLLATARRVVEGDRLVRAGEWTGFSPQLLLGAQVSGATLGIVGLGRIGRAVAARARGFGMRVLATTPHPASLDGVACVPLAQLLAESDFVSLHCPLTDATRNLIDAAALARMKPTAILVNTARGAVVDERALARALREGTIAGAGLDVFVHEPAVEPELLAAPNTVLAPHLGSASLAARAAMARLACEGVAAVLAGQLPPNRVT
jgi:glyoxylate reductase